MQPYGTDRLKPGKGDQLVLLCSRPKPNWNARVEKTLTTARHPGTAVAWDGRIFEVVVAERGAAGGARYVLEPWRDEHIIRTSESYDEESEVRRDAENQASLAREKKRKSANLAGVFTGLLPAVVQEHLASELGLLPTKLTSLSLLVPLVVVALIIHDAVRRTLDPNAAATPVVLLVIAIYLFVESGIRLLVVWTQRRPIGETAGFIAYLLYYLLTGGRALSPFTQRRGERLFITKPPDDVALRDAYTLRQPLLTLLSPDEQQALAERFGYDYRTHSRTVAIVILAAAALGVVSSFASLPRPSALASLIIAAVIGLEQIARLSALRRGPAGSILAVLVRPFTRKLLR